MDENRTATRIPPGGGEEIMADEREGLEPENRCSEPGADREADAVSPADPQGSGPEDRCGKDPGSGVPAAGDAEEPGEASADEPAGEAESPEELPEQGRDGEPDGQDNAAGAGAEDEADKAAQKLKGWKQADKHPYATLICNHLIKRCREDVGFAQDVLASDKTFAGCYSYIQDKARCEATSGCACVEDSTVYEWAEDYIRGVETKVKKPKEPAPEATENVAKKPKSVKKTTKTAAKPAKTAAKPAKTAAKPQKTTPKPPEEPAHATPDPEPPKPEPKSEESKPEEKPKAEKPEKPKKEKKPEKKPKESGMDGQIDLFSLFG